jgi:hypothetical protein
MLPSMTRKPSLVKFSNLNNRNSYAPGTGMQAVVPGASHVPRRVSHISPASIQI